MGDCSGQNLTEFPDKVPDNTFALDLSSNQDLTIDQLLMLVIRNQNVFTDYWFLNNI